jgi:UDP-N-acetylmuramyl pentapeptide phosphotransferase/UDP-N-acetylglucosamine-1-phosphate transferase
VVLESTVAGLWVFVVVVVVAEFESVAHLFVRVLVFEVIVEIGVVDAGLELKKKTKFK